jgi:hypothetical protein
MQSIKFYLKKLKNFIGNLYNAILNESYSEQKNKRFLFSFFAVSISIIFLVFFYLIKKNPLELLIPFHLFNLPQIDKRTQKSLYILDGKGDTLKVNRKILIESNILSKNIDTIISELSKPPYEDKIESQDETVFPKKTVNLKNALIIKWLVENNSRLILDFKEEYIQLELKNIKTKSVLDEEDSIFDRKTPEQEAKLKAELEKNNSIKMKTLELSFICLEKSIFENFPEIQSIEYKLNGRTKNFSNLSHDLREVRKR